MKRTVAERVFARTWQIQDLYVECAAPRWTLRNLTDPNFHSGSPLSQFFSKHANLSVVRRSGVDLLGSCQEKTLVVSIENADQSG